MLTRDLVVVCTRSGSSTVDRNFVRFVGPVVHYPATKGGAMEEPVEDYWSVEVLIDGSWIDLEFSSAEDAVDAMKLLSNR